MLTDQVPGATDDLPAAVRLLARLIPAPDRQAIVGDLVEETACRALHGVRRAAWLTSECGAIAAGLSLERLRSRLVVPPMREVVSGLAIDGRGALRDGRGGTLLRALVFVGSVATLVLGVELLVSSLMSAAGF